MFLDFNFDFENVNAAKEAKKICKHVEVIATNKLLNKYLVIGT